MPIPLIVNELTYQYPVRRDDDWGQQATEWASTVSAVLAHIRSVTLPMATSGKIRFGNTDDIAWRNFGDTLDMRLFVDASDRLMFNDGITDYDLINAGPGNVQNLNPATDEALVRFDGVTGAVIQNSLVTLSDAGAFAGIASVNTLDVSTPGDLIATGLVEANVINAVSQLQLGGVLVTDIFMERLPSATDERVVRFDGTSGNVIQESPVSINDAGDVSGVADLDASSATIDDLTVGTDIDLSGVTVASVNDVFADESHLSRTMPGVSGAGAAGEFVFSGSSGIFETMSGSFVDVPNVNITIVTTGRPVMLMLLSDGNAGHLYAKQIAGTDSPLVYLPVAEFQFVRDGVAAVGKVLVAGSVIDETVGMQLTQVSVPASSFTHVDLATPGLHAYKLQARVSSGYRAGAHSLRIVAYEL